jgi:hypothetical protein
VHVFHMIPHTGLSVDSPYTIPVNISRGNMSFLIIEISLSQMSFALNILLKTL